MRKAIGLKDQVLSCRPEARDLLVRVLAAILLTSCASSRCHAQISTTVDVATDYRLRGLSLTDRTPAFSLSLAYDDPTGFYAGGTALGSASLERVRPVGATGYLGFTHPIGNDLALDAGASYQDYTLYFRRASTLRYAEVYVGTILRDFSAHLYFKPDNPRPGVASSYADLNWSLHPARAWRLGAHLGANQRLGGTTARDGGRWRFDTQFGVVREFTHSEMEVSWTENAGENIPHPVQTRPGLAVDYRRPF